LKHPCEKKSHAISVTLSIKTCAFFAKIGAGFQIRKIALKTIHGFANLLSLTNKMDRDCFQVQTKGDNL